MPATVHLRDGGRLVLLTVTTLRVQVRLTPDGPRSMLVCRDDAGLVVAQFDGEDVLAFHRPSRATPVPRVLPPTASQTHR